MSEATQVFAWAAGAFDAIEREHWRDSNGSRFTVIGITRSSVEARCRFLRGYAVEATKRIEGLRAFGTEIPLCSSCRRKLVYSNDVWSCYEHGEIA